MIPNNSENTEFQRFKTIIFALQKFYRTAIIRKSLINTFLLVIMFFMTIALYRYQA